jgi:6,7-dimethyl-8-ribityllumazine synthase
MASNLRNLSSYDPASVPAGNDMSIGLVVSEWNSDVTKALEEGAVSTLLEHGVLAENIQVRYVPGSFELPLGGQFLIESAHPDAIILLGCVIQGETRHFDFICNAVSNGCMDLGLKYGLPVIFGVLTTQNLEQALDRAGGRHGNKGTEAAITALKMVELKRG